MSAALEERLFEPQGAPIGLNERPAALKSEATIAIGMWIVDCGFFKDQNFPLVIFLERCAHQVKRSSSAALILSFKPLIKRSARQGRMPILKPRRGAHQIRSLISLLCMPQINTLTHSKPNFRRATSSVFNFWRRVDLIR
jgi:hypothetical protein